MIAFVLSGGGNRGPLQVGALQALFAHGLWPNLLVGTSAGSINAAYIAACGEPSCTATLGQLWRKASQTAVYPGNVLTMAWRVLTGADSLFPSDGIRRLLEKNLPAGVTTFGDLTIPCFVTAVDLRSGRLYLFGEDPAAPLAPAILASSSVPGIHPPVPYRDLQLVDGGVLANVPASIAMDHGATEIFAVNVGYGGEMKEPARGVFQIFLRTLNTFMARSLWEDLDRALFDPIVNLHHIHIGAFADLPFNDFGHVDGMIEAGRAATETYLANPSPLTILPQPAAPAAPNANLREYLLPTQRRRQARSAPRAPS